jgi:hypothetical protein
MPVPALKNLVKKYHTSMKRAERYWEESKDAVSKSYTQDDPAYWGTVMKITKSKLKKLLSNKVFFSTSKTYINQLK